MNHAKINIFLYFLLNLFDIWIVLHYYDRVLEAIKKYDLIKKVMSVLFVILFSVFIKYDLKYCNLVSFSFWSLSQSNLTRWSL